MIDARAELLLLRDEGNAEFEAKLTPCSHTFLGARLPEMRRLARRIAKDGWREYLDSWRPEFFEDYMLRGMVIAYAEVPLEERLRLYGDFVPLIDNWSVCDSFCSTWKPKPEEKDALWSFVRSYMDSDDEFRMRFATVMMMDHFLEDGYVDRVIAEMDRARNDGYYLKMAVAWCLATCLAKYPDRTMRYLKGDCSLDDWTYSRTVQKALESYRVPDAVKDELRRMRKARGGQDGHRRPGPFDIVKRTVAHARPWSLRLSLTPCYPLRCRQQPRWRHGHWDGARSLSSSQRSYCSAACRSSAWVCASGSMATGTGSSTWALTGGPRATRSPGRSRLAGASG
jgi:3-methyladenine DNA glycosylase AlkD